jgi:acetyltransferase-like isoleucine patch superfamily enzyme
MEYDNVSSINEKEVMDFYGLKGGMGKINLRLKILRSWLLHKSAYSSINSSWIVSLQRSRGVNIGKNCHFSPYVLIDLIYPGMISIGDNVTIGSNTMIFAHYNPTANKLLKENGYPRDVKQVTIEDGAVIGPGSIITMGTTIGKNSIIGAGSVVSNKIPDLSVALGNPARVIKKINL